MKRLCMFTLLLLLLASVLPLIANGKDDAALSEKPTIQVSILDRGKVPVEKGSYEKNDVTAWINEHSPVNVEFIPITRWETRQKYTLLLASGEAPDIMTEYSVDLMQDFVNQGLLKEMGPYVDKFGPNIRELTPRATAQWGFFSGKEYAIPNQRSEVSKANWNMIVRKDWLDQLGLDVPSTIDEFYIAAEAMKKAGLGNGFDLMGRGVYALGLLENLYGIAENWVLVDGELELKQFTDNFKQARALAAKFYQNGIVDPEYFTDNGGTKAEQEFVTGKLGFFATNRAQLIYPTLLKNIPTAEVVPVPPMNGPYGINAYYQEREVQLLNVTPTTCENPEAVVKYLDWMLAEGWEWVIYGDEGIHYEVENGVKISLADTDMVNRDLVYRLEYALLSQDNLTPDDILIQKSRLTDPLQIAATKLSVNSMKSTLAVPFKRAIPTSGLDVLLYTELYADMEKFTNETYTKAIIGEITVDEADVMVRNEMNNLGYQELKTAINTRARELGYIK